MSSGVICERGLTTSQPALLTRMSMCWPKALRVSCMIVSADSICRRSALTEMAFGEGESDWIWLRRSWTAFSLFCEVYVMTT